MSDEKDKTERPSMRSTLGLVVNNEKPGDDLERLRRQMAFGGGRDDDSDDEEGDEDQPMLEAATLEIQQKDTVAPSYYESDVTEDYKFSRNMLYTLMNEGAGALAESLRMARQSQHPRAFEIVNALTNTMRSLTQDLMGLQKSFNEATAGKEDKKKTAEASESGAQQQKPATAQGSTASIMEVLRAAREAEKAQQESVNKDGEGESN